MRTVPGEIQSVVNQSRAVGFSTTGIRAAVILFIVSVGALTLPNGNVILAATGARASSSNSITTAAAAPATGWSVETSIDKLTDEQTIVASTVAYVAGPSSPMYELTLRCSAGSYRILLATFNEAGQARPIAWNLNDPSWTEAKGTQHLRWRVDSNPVDGIVLTATHTNAGEMMHMFLWKTLPRERLVIADVLDDETVEFSFANLSTTHRVALQHACFAPPPPPPPPPADTIEYFRQRQKEADGREAAKADILKQVEGSAPARVRELLGAPSSQQSRHGVKIWYYRAASSRLGDAVTVYFRDDVASLEPPRN